MERGFKVIDRTFIAEGEVTQGMPVTLSSDGKVKVPADGDVVIGVALYDAADGEPVSVRMAGTAMVKVAEAFAKGSFVVGGPNGAKDVTPDDAGSYVKVLGVALEEATEAGELIEVLIVPSIVKGII